MTPSIEQRNNAAITAALVRSSSSPTPNWRASERSAADHFLDPRGGPAHPLRAVVHRPARPGEVLIKTPRRREAVPVERAAKVDSQRRVWGLVLALRGPDVGTQRCAREQHPGKVARAGGVTDVTLVRAERVPVVTDTAKPPLRHPHVHVDRLRLLRLRLRLRL